MPSLAAANTVFEAFTYTGAGLAMSPSREVRLRSVPPLATDLVVTPRMKSTTSALPMAVCLAALRLV